GVGARESLRAHDVDVVSLDIQRPGLTGFELLERLERQPLVIFTTAFDRYALNAFEANSIDYLLKPIEPERLERALDKAARLSEPRPDVRALARELATHLAPGRRLERVASPGRGRTTRPDVRRLPPFRSKTNLTLPP